MARARAEFGSLCTCPMQASLRVQQDPPGASARLPQPVSAKLLCAVARRSTLGAIGTRSPVRRGSIDPCRFRRDEEFLGEETAHAIHDRQGVTPRATHSSPSGRGGRGRWSRLAMAVGAGRGPGGRSGALPPTGPPTTGTSPAPATRPSTRSTRRTSPRWRRSGRTGSIPRTGSSRARARPSSSSR